MGAVEGVKMGGGRLWDLEMVLLDGWMDGV